MMVGVRRRTRLPGSDAVEGDAQKACSKQMQTRHTKTKHMPSMQACTKETLKESCIHSPFISESRTLLGKHACIHTYIYASHELLVGCSTSSTCVA